MDDAAAFDGVDNDAAAFGLLLLVRLLVLLVLPDAALLIVPVLLALLPPPVLGRFCDGAGRDVPSQKSHAEHLQ